MANCTKKKRGERGADHKSESMARFQMSLFIPFGRVQFAVYTKEAMYTTVFPSNISFNHRPRLLSCLPVGSGRTRKTNPRGQTACGSRRRCPGPQSWARRSPLARVGEGWDCGPTSLCVCVCVCVCMCLFVSGVGTVLRGVSSVGGSLADGWRGSAWWERSTVDHDGWMDK
jgi:hypothetical protein